MTDMTKREKPKMVTVWVACRWWEAPIVVGNAFLSRHEAETAGEHDFVISVRIPRAEAKQRGLV